MKKTYLFSLMLMVTSVITSAQQHSIGFLETAHDFGYVKEGEKATYVFTFDNNHEDSIKLKQVRPSCGCTSPFWTKEPIAPGSSGEIKVSYNSHKRPGAFLKRVNVTPEGDFSPVTLFIKGVVIPDTLPEGNNAKASLQLSHSTLQFGKIETKRTSTREVTVTNNGKKAVTVQDIKAGCHCIGWKMENKTVAPGESSTLRIHYSPRSEGKNSDIAVLITDNPQQPVQQLTIKATTVESLIDNNMMQQEQNNTFKF